MGRSRNLYRMLLNCEHCDARVDAVVLHQYTLTDDDAPTFLVSLAKCPQCSSPLLAQQMEDFGPGAWLLPERLYPQPESALSTSLPKPIREAFNEARACLKAGAYTAAAMMCRKTLEGICAEHGHRGRTLADSLKSMRDAGVIENRLFEWADALRLYGNEAAHDVNVTVPAQDASDLIEFGHALIEYVFTYRDKFDAFQKRRSHRQERGK
jgi:hypothetical protein